VRRQPALPGDKLGGGVAGDGGGPAGGGDDGGGPAGGGGDGSVDGHARTVRRAGEPGLTAP
jgi:hypothetical protein